jgi:hypothetical protein
MPTLAIETGIEPEYEQALQEAARTEGWKVESVQNIPFTDQFITGDPHMGDPLPESLLMNPLVWFHGSIQAAKRAQEATKWQVHAPWHQLRCSTYYPLLRGRLLQRDHLFTTIGEVRTRKDELFTSSLVEDDTLFFRPDGNDKVFTGGCISRPEFDKGYALMTFYDPSPSTPVVVARPQRIRSEARFLIVDGKVITGSFYKTGGQTVRLEAHDALLRIAEDHLGFCLERGFNPAPSWILDLAETSDGWSIIEVGASSCCGLYKCDLLRFIQALTPLIRSGGS